MQPRTSPIRSFLALLAGLSLSGCGVEQATTVLPAEPTPPVTELVLTPSSASLAFLGAQLRLTATLRNSRGDAVTAPRIYWESLDPNIATVDTAGLVTGVAEGSARVRAQFLALADTVPITVARVPVGMTLTHGALLFTAAGRTVDVDATVRDGSGGAIPAPKVSWTSSAPGVATVDGAGVIKAVADGTATISAKADTVTRVVSVRVATRPTTISVTPASVAMDGISDTARVITVIRDAAGVSMYPLVPTYTSSDTSVVRVDFIGFLIARKPGTATITVRADSLVRTVPVTVTQVIQTVRVHPDTGTVAVGATRAHAALVKDRFGNAVAGATVTWTSSNSGVATVSGAGLVTGVAAGTATITAASGGKSGTAQVKVVAGSGQHGP